MNPVFEVWAVVDDAKKAVLVGTAKPKEDGGYVFTRDEKYADSQLSDVDIRDGKKAVTS